MKLRRARQPTRGRIEIIPMIDVMFFLLATFMLASLSMQHVRAMAVDLPRGEAPPLAGRQTPITLTVSRGGQLRLDEAEVTLATLAATLAPRLRGHAITVLVNADAGAAHGLVTQAMLQAREAGATNFSIGVRLAP